VRRAREGARGRTDHPRGAVTGQVQLSEARCGDGTAEATRRGSGLRERPCAAAPVGVRLGAVRPTPAGLGRQGHFREVRVELRRQKKEEKVVAARGREQGPLCIDSGVPAPAALFTVEILFIGADFVSPLLFSHRHTTS